MSLTSETWKIMDDSVQRFMGVPKEERNTPDALKAAGEARGIAKVLHLLCKPHFEDDTAVAKHAVKRFRAAQAGDEMPPTPGDMNDAEAQQAVVAKHEETKAKAKAAPKRAESKQEPSKSEPDAGNGDEEQIKKDLAKLRESQIAQIKNGLSANFPHDKLASLYKISVETVTHISRMED